MPQCVGKMVQVSNLYLQMGASKILNKRLSEFGRKPNNKSTAFVEERKSWKFSMSCLSRNHKGVKIEHV